MVLDMVKEIAGFYNKKVVFNMEFGEVTKDTKTFKLGEEVIGDTRYLTTANITEFDDHVEVIKIGIMSINNENFLEMNPNRKRVVA